jgi:hypothetical protein
VAPATPPADQKTATPTGQPDIPLLDPESLLNTQDRKSAFLDGAVDRKTVSPDRLENPVSRYVVQAGAVIPAALITGIRSDLPGEVTAHRQNVYDSPSGRFLLIPQGSKLVGTYDSQISFGQDRVLLVWTRLIMPNGRSIVAPRGRTFSAAKNLTTAVRLFLRFARCRAYIQTDLAAAVPAVAGWVDGFDSKSDAAQVRSACLGGKQAMAHVCWSSRSSHSVVACAAWTSRKGDRRSGARRY